MTQVQLTAETFFARLIPRPGGCRDWYGALQRTGYGKTRYQRRDIGTHRLAWIFAYGPIPDGLFVCHHCDRPACCEPTHLFVDTQAGNIHDRDSKGRTARGDRSGSRLHPESVARGEDVASSVLTADDVTAICRRFLAGGITQVQLADEYGVTPPAIRGIVNGQWWKHVDVERRSEEHLANRYDVGAMRPNAQFTDADVIALRARYVAGGITYQALADEHNVTIATMWNLVTGRTWKHLPMPSQPIPKYVHPSGDRHPNSALTVDQVVAIRHRHATERLTLDDLARDYGVTKSNISCIVTGKTWRHLLPAAMSV